ncbi:MAG TPA: CoA transferase [Pseudomonadales bacterium]|jgi:crotonobetainyl-CoA:carnitine CoA-transferase CaiB-like acyl-CoA transferase|nr:hypothetical protein [Gammaproteobacteria bacterium]MDP6027511.1 CoA transferase [Pseudomonadales bacterium]MDP6317074.1 CoA transferase [Pseudomonadales bacterium]MDP7316249.1 CoA transferase [Pseudomonadales bacterium]HJP52394.1 CoA transferase [Pseudomonadales bacterium]|tara:strand:- start:516 stop:1739 length:1224 start_codon:yes stop_codon:yes gene_type:complete
MAGPLTGVNVLEFSQVIAAPFGGQALADLGASVLKVEPPDGDSWRLQLQFRPTESKTFQCLNRGKDSLTLSLNQAAAQKIVHQLIPEIDVVLINYRPDVPEKFNIDYQTLSAIKQDLIYVDLTAFGRKGPWSLRPGYDGAVQAVSGLMAAEGKTKPGEGSPMTISSTAVADFCSGVAMAEAVTTALYHRQMTGEGQMVECSLLSTALNLQLPIIMEHQKADAKRNATREQRLKRSREGAQFRELVEIRQQASDVENNYFYRSFLTKDGAVVIAADSVEEKAAVRKLFDLSNDPDNQAIDAMKAAISSKSSDAILDDLRQFRIPTAPVRYPDEMNRDEAVLANEWLFELEHDTTGPQTQMRLNLEFSESALTEPSASPPLGRDTARVLKNLDYSEEAIAAFREAGVVS